MSQLTGLPVGASGFIEPKRERLSGLWILLALFILGAATVSPVKGWSIIVHGLGFVLAFAYLIETLRGRMHIAPEMFLYFGWIGWCLTGALEHPSAYWFWIQYTTAFQIFVLAVIVSGFTNSRKVMSLNMVVFLVAALVVGVYSYVTGEYRAAEAGAGVRLRGLAMNANSFGWIMLLAAVALAYLWMLPTRVKLLKYVVILVCFAAVGVSELLAFSRTFTVAMAFFFLAWVWLCYRKTLARRVVVPLIVIVLLCVAGYLGYVLFVQTGGTVRIQEIQDVLSGRLTSGSVYIRLMNFKTGWKLLWEHPLTGMGLYGFAFSMPSGVAAHNEYVEIAVDTGLPGFLLYFGVLWVLWRRAGKLVKYADTPFLAQVGNLTRALVLTVLVTDLGSWHYAEKTSWIILGSFIGFTHVSWRSLRQRIASQPAEAQASGVPVSRLATGPMEVRPGLSTPSRAPGQPPGGLTAWRPLG